VPPTGVNGKIAPYIYSMTFRIASYNIRKCIGLDRRRDPIRTAQVIHDLGADVLLLQEADKRLGARPAALPRAVISAETGMQILPLGDGDASLGSHGNALLISDKIELEHIEFKDLPGFEPRGALIASLRSETATLRVIGVHLGLRRRDRIKQLTALQTYLKTLPPRPTLIAGDFNEWSRNKGLEPLSDMQVLTPGRSFHAARPIAYLDRIAHCDALQMQAAGVDQSSLARRASDHLPIWAEFTVDHQA